MPMRIRKKEGIVLNFITCHECGDPPCVCAFGCGYAMQLQWYTLSWMLRVFVMRMQKKKEEKKRWAHSCAYRQKKYMETIFLVSLFLLLFWRMYIMQYCKYGDFRPIFTFALSISISMYEWVHFSLLNINTGWKNCNCFGSYFKYKVKSSQNHRRLQLNTRHHCLLLIW